MNRRKFVRNSILVSGGIVFSGAAFAGKTKNTSSKLTILHTNDTHSNIDPFPSNHAKFANMGGVSRRFELIKKIREEEENVLLLDAGDIFQGTPYFNKYGGVLELKIMSILGYDAATMGNHEFDGGMDGFLKATEFANFPFVCANYDFSNTLLNGKTQENVIIQKGSLKIGIFGIGVELEGLVPKDKFGATIYRDPIEVANQQAEILTKKDCDLIICLSHLGFEYASNRVSDKVLAKSTKNIHLIIGGHTHTFMEKAFEEKNLEGKSVLINQTGWGGLYMGRIDLEFQSESFTKKNTGKEVVIVR